jgi:hypothetical protein
VDIADEVYDFTYSITNELSSLFFLIDIAGQLKPMLWSEAKLPYMSDQVRRRIAESCMMEGVVTNPVRVKSQLTGTVSTVAPWFACLVINGGSSMTAPHKKYHSYSTRLCQFHNRVPSGCRSAVSLTPKSRKPVYSVDIIHRQAILN